MRKLNPIRLLVLLAVGLLTFQQASPPVYAAGVGKIKAVCLAVLEDLGITSGGTFSGIQTGDDATLGRLGVDDGTLAAPALYFTSDDDGSGTGLYRQTPNKVGHVINGVAEMALDYANLNLIGVDLYLTGTNKIAMGNGQLNLEYDAGGSLRVDNGVGTTNDGNLYLVSADEADGVFLSANGTAGWLEVGSTLGASNGSVVAGFFRGGAGSAALQEASGYWIERQGLGFQLPSDASIQFSDNADPIVGAEDTIITRAEANVLRLDGDGSAGVAAKLAVSGIAPMNSSTDLSFYDNAGTRMGYVSSTGLTLGESGAAGGLAIYNSGGNNRFTVSTGANEVNLGPASGFDFKNGSLNLCFDGSNQQIEIGTGSDGASDGQLALATLTADTNAELTVIAGATNDTIQIRTNNDAKDMITFWDPAGDPTVQLPNSGEIAWSGDATSNSTPAVVMGYLSDDTIYVSGDNDTRGTAAKIAVSGIAPMGSTVGVTDDLAIYDANGDRQVLFDTSAETIYFSPGNSGTTRFSINDTTNGVNVTANLTGQNASYSLFGFNRSTFAYPSGGAMSAGNTGMVSHNDGATGVSTITLPAGSSTATGNYHTFVVQENQEFRIDPNANDKILDTDMTGLVDGEYITSSTVNSSITIMLTSDDDWVVLSKTGTWTEETP